MITRASSSTTSSDSNLSSIENGKSTVRIAVPLWQITYRTLFTYTFCAPLIAYITVMSAGYLLHRDVITNYKTECGNVLMPSFSRIIGVPMERTLFNLLILTHVPLRFIIVWINWRQCLFWTPRLKIQALVTFVTKVIVFFGCFEVISVIGVTITGERENKAFHDKFFAGYGICGVTYSIMTTFISYHNPKVRRISFWLKMVSTVAFTLFMPVVGSLYNIFKAYCIVEAYNVFAYLEYIAILINMTFHSSFAFDCNDLYQFQITVECPESSLTKNKYTISYVDLQSKSSYSTSTLEFNVEDCCNQAQKKSLDDSNYRMYKTNVVV